MRDPKCDSKNNSLLPSDLSLRAHVVDAGELDDWDCRDTGTDRASEPSHLMSRTKTLNLCKSPELNLNTTSDAFLENPADIALSQSTRSGDLSCMLLALLALSTAAQILPQIIIKEAMHCYVIILQDKVGRKLKTKKSISQTIFCSNQRLPVATPNHDHITQHIDKVDTTCKYYCK